MNIKRIALLLMSVPLIASAQDKAPDQEKLALQGVRVVVGDGTELPLATVCVEGGRIVKIDTGETEPSGFKLLKLKGHTMYPGFIDAHVSRGVKAPPAPVETGKPNSSISAPSSIWIGNRKGITPEWKAAENLDFSVDKSYYEVGITSVNVVPSQGSLRGTCAHMNLLPASVESRLLRKDTVSSMSFRIGSGPGYPSNILGQIALMRQVLWDAKSVADGAELYPASEKAPFWMASLNALQPVVKNESVVFFEANLDREIERAFKLKDEFGIKMVIAGARDAYRCLDLLKSNAMPVVLNADMGSEPSLAPINKDDQTPQPVRDERLARWKQQVAGPKLLADAGVTLAITSGPSTSDFLKNLRLLVKNGLPPAKVLAGVTTVPASMLGAASELGTIEVGKRANLIIASGDLFAESTTVVRVYVDGRTVLAPAVAEKSKSANREVRR